MSVSLGTFFHGETSTFAGTTAAFRRPVGDIILQHFRMLKCVW